ncbi:MAG: hypothetical protein M3454_17195 [Actinomycetota bacterium]|nr:hypothetical protein [Actinomycetota bacterium]
MAESRFNWELLQEAADRLARQGGSPFTRQELIQEVQRNHPERGSGSLGPILQALTLNAQGGPSSAGGALFFRVGRGLYERFEAARHSGLEIPAEERAYGRSRRQSERHRILQDRMRELIEDFPDYLHSYDQRVPFVRSGQWSSHDETIRRRRELGSVTAALQDEAFLRSLYETLKKWGIGKRASRLVPLEAFSSALRERTADVAVLERSSLEDPTLDVDGILGQLWSLINTMPIVENKAKVVAGTKTLHHLLPDLVPPMDRDWTGDFFIWSLNDFQNRQRAIFEEGFRSFVHIARHVHPSQYVGTGWRTGPAKILDNAIIGFMLEQVPAPGAQEVTLDLPGLTTGELLDLQEQVAVELELRRAD